MADNKELLDSALHELGYITGMNSIDVIEFNSETADIISGRMRKISNNISDTCSTIKAIISQANSSWTGTAAESFIFSCQKLITSTEEFSQKLETDRNNIELAAQRLAEGDNNSKGKIDQLSTNDIF